MLRIFRSYQRALCFISRRMAEHTLMSLQSRNKNRLYGRVSILSDLAPQSKSLPSTTRISFVAYSELPSPAPESLRAEPRRCSVSMAILPHIIYSK